MKANPIISAKLQFVSEAFTRLTASYIGGELGDDDALAAAAEILDTFASPIEATATTDGAGRVEVNAKV